MTIEFQISSPSGKQTARATYDTKQWLMRNMKVLGGLAPETEIGYTYTEFKGVTMLSEVSVVMGSMGFMKIQFTNYRSARKMTRDELKAF